MEPAPAPSKRIRHYFDPAVAARGDVLAAVGRVRIVAGGAVRVTGRVSGRLPYDTELAVAGAPARAIVASCTCAHATKALCKHVWATLLVAEQRGHLTRADDVEDLAAFPAAASPPRFERRWRIDLPASRGDGQLRLDRFERTVLGPDRSSGFRMVPRLQRRRELRPTLRELADPGACVVHDRDGMAPEPFVLDEGPPLRLVAHVTEGDASPDHDLPALHAHGTLERAGAVRPCRDVFGFGAHDLAFTGGAVTLVHAPRCGPFLRLAREGPLRIPARDAASFVRQLLEQGTPETLRLPPGYTVAHDVPCVARVKIAAAGGPERSALPATLAFDYDGVPAGLPPSKASLLADPRNPRRFVRRDRDAEDRARSALVAAGFRRADRGDDPGRVALRIARAALGPAVRSLDPSRFVFEVDGVVQRQATADALRVVTDIDWFEVRAHLAFGPFAVSSPALLEAARRGERTVRLGDGSVGLLPEAWLAQMAQLASLAEASEPGDETLRFRRAQVALVDAVLAKAQNDVTWDGPLAALRDTLARTRSFPPAAPGPAFRGTLRAYQQQGLAWLVWLESVGFSGCLADDMGLGKTVQVLALLTTRTGRGPSLVVAPRSLVPNWLDEAARFAPALRARELHGTTSTETALASDVLVTTYDAVRRGIATRAGLSFDYVVLDEAQAIKNAAAATTRAVGGLRSRHRLALTGTPVENHLGELYSLFAFLDPGMLPRPRRRATERDQALDADLAAAIGHALRPFVLRRTKAEVLPELPALVEEALVVTMGPAQRAGYDRVKRYYQAVLRRRIEEGGVARARLHVLEALLRLRQLACHPGLVDPAQVDAPSAKLEALLAKLEPLAAQGKKALVFSQFTGLLDLVERALRARGIRPARLDGSTADRRAPRTRFQEDPSCLVMLVSLKAGGTGLNLTAAEYVFVLDPWWNPAAEAQAIARAHRLGQERPVIAYRLVCADTVEERVAELQEKKRRVSDAVVGAAEDPAPRILTEADLALLLGPPTAPTTRATG